MLWMIFVGVFVSAVVQAIIRRQRRIERAPSLDDPRWGAEPTRQIVGSRCIECGGKVVKVGDAEACHACGDVAHVVTCLARHQRSAHRPTTQIPYR